MTIAPHFENPKPADEVRFGFGENWASYSRQLDDDRIAEAERSIQKLLGIQRLDGLRFLDIGSGSGLFSLAARRLGARVHSFDYDPASVDCTTSVRTRYAPGDPDWQIERGSVLDAEYMDRLGTFDIVYSWGVLHHTGAMYRALDLACARVAHGGFAVFALYRKTRLCRAWTIEKRWYAAASPTAQQFARAIFIGLMRFAYFISMRDFKGHVEKYKSLRGMDFYHDVHDWMGGYPYESISPAELAKVMSKNAFEHVRSVTRPYETGLFGSGCDEYVYRCVG